MREKDYNLGNRLVRALWICLCCFSFFGILHLEALESENPDISLTPQPPPPEKVLGLQFGDSSRAITLDMKKMGVDVWEPVQDPNPRDPLTASKFDGVPEGLWVQDGQTTAYFFQDRMFRFGISFQPNYQNFLLIRKQLLSSLGNRFTIEEQREVIDPLLKSNLAMREDDALDQSAEEAVKAAMGRGNTFFFYKLKDNQGILDVNLSFSASKTPKGVQNPKLVLNYSEIKEVEEITAWEESQANPILPK